MPLKGLVSEMIKATASKSLVIRVNLIFIAFFVIVYAALFLRPSSFYQESAASIVLCSLRDCHMKKVEDGYKMKAVLETQLPEKKMVKEMRPSFVDDIVREKRIGMVNMDDDEVGEFANVGNVTAIRYQPVSGNLEWKDLFPEWIDEEEDDDGPSCPEMPMPDFGMYGEVDVVMAKLPCRYPEEGWSRSVFRLQIHVIAANLAVKNGRRGGGEKTRVVFFSSCRPMLELFRCDDLVKQEGDWWVYEPDMGKLEQKVWLPIGSCKLALPLWGRGINQVYNLSKILTSTAKNTQKEAYATVIHSSEAYVCGAIALGQSIIKTGTTRDLIILLDKSISQPKREALMQAGWKIREIKRIRNPKAENNSYNEYNYSKFRLWQLTDYHKIIFIDSDIIVLRNLDLLFHFPQLSATGNDGVIFNSGIMVIEPSKCTFKFLMEQRTELISYNGGDQGFLNEVYVWWHRLPRRVNFLKNFWSNTTLETSMKNQLFGADPPKLYAIHFLGLKPWLCYRDYDCNWNIADQHVYASDIAHERWWRFHDAMNETLQRFCGLSERRKIELDWDRKMAREHGFLDEHWRFNISDPRRQMI
ncbi:UDP-glucuronate:xylan alpha-glucuronosyltransferase 2-like protein isoform X1 [Cinnamomum micranthum f. kanehirae]|uniref:Hexosyltransferase n=1 Tax=Cinnamomum micranthum f. kanehirae TaxID=337451 RepID=A0A443PP45_9MAGN|nr:UDP-glucuronate:xylan alpha-glucuronosyltransferase 2-like protein isoform X1 [Cinnamomum micranthum f. kanehirae]